MVLSSDIRVLRFRLGVVEAAKIWGDRSKLVIGERTGAQHARRTFAEIYNGGRRALWTRAGVEVHRDARAQLHFGFITGARHRFTDAVGAHHHHRTRTLQHLERHRMQRHSHRDKRSIATDVPRQRGLLRTQGSEGTWPKPFDQGLPLRVQRHRLPRRRLRRGLPRRGRQ